MNEQTQAGGNQPLPVGHTLLWYSLEQVLGHGGFGTTYLATDNNLNRKVAIKEYLPSIFAYRDSDLTVKPLTEDHGENYRWGLTSFLNEARTLAQFKHRNVVQVQTVFEEYDTAYMVMEYEQGEPLDSTFKNRPEALNQPFFENLLFLVMDGLQAIHDAGFIHRDIKPGNLYIRADGSPVLIDFGSARETSQQKTSEMTTLVSQGYTPLEQYSPNFGEQGPWTDIYALAASVYHGVVGRKPEDALNRSASLLSSKPDPLPALSPMQLEGYSQRFSEAIDIALALKPADRPQSLSEWRKSFEKSNTEPVAPPQKFDDDATRLLPPVHTRLQDEQPLPSYTPTELSDSGQRSRDDFDALDWDSHSNEQERVSEPELYNTAKVSPETPANSSSLPMIMGVGILVVALGAGGWWFTQNQSDTADGLVVDSEFLNTLPSPGSTMELTSPERMVATEIAELRGLSTVYQNILTLDADSGQGREGISFIVQNYQSIANLDVIKYSESLRSKLAAAVQAVSLKSDTNGQAESLANDLAEMKSNHSFSDVEQLLNNENRTDADNESLLFALGYLPEAERTIALADKRVAALTTQFKRSIIKAIQKTEFERASHMTALALLVAPQDPELNLLRKHIEKS